MEDNLNPGNPHPPYGNDNSGRDYLGAGVWLRRRRGECAGSSRLFVAVCLVVAGTLLFLDNIGVLRIRNLWDYWPIILIAFGVGKLSGGRQNSERLAGLFLVLFGALFLLLTLHVFAIHSWDDSWPLSLLLIAFGVIALIKAVETRQWRPPATFPVPGSAESTNDVVNENTVLGSIKRRHDTTNFSGGHIDAFLGSVEIDLRYAQISTKEKSVRLDVNCFLGSTKVRIPDNWILSIQTPAILSSIEDRTIPPRTVSGILPPTLLITGQCVLGSIEIEN